MPKQEELKTVMITCYKCSWSYSSHKTSCPMCGANPIINQKELVRILGEYIERQGLFSSKKECASFIKKFKKERKRLPVLDELWTSAVNYVKLQTMDKKDLKKMKEKNDIDLKAQMEKMRLRKIKDKQKKSGAKTESKKEQIRKPVQAEGILGDFKASFSWKKGKFKGKYFFGKPKTVAKTRHTGSAMSIIPTGADLKLSEVALSGTIAFKGHRMRFKAKEGDTKVILDMREIIKIKKKEGSSMDTRVVSILLNSHGNYAKYGEQLIFTIYCSQRESVEEIYEEIIDAQNWKESTEDKKIEDKSDKPTVLSREDRLEALKRKRMEAAGETIVKPPTKPKEEPEKPQVTDNAYIICPTCGTKNPSGSKFCLEDGTPLE